jgi:hypothetical protein
MKFYVRQKPYKYGARLVFFWKYRAKDGRWQQRQVYWGNRETEAITSRYGCIKNIANLSDGVERRDLICRTRWLNRGVEDYSDEHFSQSIYLRLVELKKQTPKLPKREHVRRAYGPRKKKVAVISDKLEKEPNTDMPRIESTPEKRDLIRKIMDLYNKFIEPFYKEAELNRIEEEKHSKEAIKKANRIRAFGEKLQLLTGNKKFLKRDFDRFQAAFPAGTTLKFCRLAMSTWLTHPDPIENLFQAECIVTKMTTLKNRAIHDEMALRRLAEEKALRQQAVASAVLSSRKSRNLVPTISVAANTSKLQFYWEFFK